MVDPVCVNPEILISRQHKGLLLLPYLLEPDLKGKLRCDDAQRAHDLFHPFGSADQKGLRSLRVSHGQKKARQAAAVVRVKVGEKNEIDGLGAPSLAPKRHLCPLSAVDQYTLAIVPHHK